MNEKVLVDPDALREQVREKYREVALEPKQAFHFHTGRDLARRLSYDNALVDQLPDRAVESFAGVGNPFSLCPIGSGERVVDIGSGAGFDSFIAAMQTGTCIRARHRDPTVAKPHPLILAVRWRTGLPRC